MGNQTVYDREYFRWPHPAISFPLAFFVCLIVMMYVSPGYIPVAFMGPLARLVVYLVTFHPNIVSFLFWFLVVGHTLESIYTFKLARDRQLSTSTTLKWILLTLLYGAFSIILLQRSAKKTS